MGLFDRFKRPEYTTVDRVVTPNRAVRTTQLTQLEAAVTDVMTAMQFAREYQHPGWHPLLEEYSELLDDVRDVRQGDPT